VNVMNNSDNNGSINEPCSLDSRRFPAPARDAALDPSQPRLSVVLGFRDWGLDRLDLTLRAHRASSLADSLELVVVDYGSKDAAAVQRTAQRWQAKVCRVQTRGRWNRSRSLQTASPFSEITALDNRERESLFVEATK